MDLACQCQISSHPTAIISALIIAKELPLLPGSTAKAVLQISWSPDNSYTNDEMSQKIVTSLFFYGFALRSHYWKFLDDPGRCGVLYTERAKCCTRITSFWLPFLQTFQDSEGPDSLVREECRKIVLANWSRLLSKCVLGDKDVISRLRDFNLDLACKKDVERVIAWLKVSL